MAKKRTKAAQDNAGLNVDGMGMLGGQNAVQQSPVPGLPGVGNAPTHLGPMSKSFPYAGAASLGAGAGNEGPQNPYASSANISGAGLEDVQASINQLNQNNQMAFPAVNKYAAQDNSKDQRSSTGEDNGVSFTTRDEDHATGPAAWESLSKFMKTAQEVPGKPAAKPALPDWLSKNLQYLGRDVTQLQQPPLGPLLPTSKDLGQGLASTMSDIFKRFKKPPQELPAIFQNQPGSNKPFFEDVGEFIGGVGGLLPTSKDLGQGLGSTLGNIFKKGGMDKYVKTGQELPLRKEPDSGQVMEPWNPSMFDPTGRGSSLWNDDNLSGRVKAMALQRHYYERQQKAEQLGVLPDGVPRTGTFIQGQLQGQQPQSGYDPMRSLTPPGSPGAIQAPPIHRPSKSIQGGSVTSSDAARFFPESGTRGSSDPARFLPESGTGGSIQGGSVTAPGAGSFLPDTTEKGSIDKYVKQAQGVLRNVAKAAKPGGLKPNRAAAGVPKNLGRNPQRPEGTPGHFRWDSTVEDGDVWSDPSGVRQDGTPWPLNPFNPAPGGEHRGADKYVKTGNMLTDGSLIGKGALYGGGAGGVLGGGFGALAGGMHGLALPGDDEEGKQRSRLREAFKRSLLFGGVGVLGGGLGGAALGAGLGGAATLGGRFLAEEGDELINTGLDAVAGEVGDRVKEDATGEGGLLQQLLQSFSGAEEAPVTYGGGTGEEPTLPDWLTEHQGVDKYAKTEQPADQTPRHDCHGVHPNQTHEEWKASLEKDAFSKYAMQPADQSPRHDCNAVHPDTTHEDWVREEFDNPPTRDWEREKEKQAQSSYHRRYPKHDWSQYEGLEDIMSPYQGWNSVWEGLKPSNWAPGSMPRRTNTAVKDYLLGKNKQYPLSKDRRWSYNRPGLKLYEGTAPKELGPPMPAPKKVPTGKASTYAVPSPSDRVSAGLSAHQPRRPFVTGKPGGSDGWWSGAAAIASVRIPQDAVEFLKEAGYAPFPCAFFGGLINSGVSRELFPAALEKAAGLVGAEFVGELRRVDVSELLEKVAQSRTFFRSIFPKKKVDLPTPSKVTPLSPTDPKFENAQTPDNVYPKLPEGEEGLKSWVDRPEKAHHRSLGSGGTQPSGRTIPAARIEGATPVAKPAPKDVPQGPKKKRKESQQQFEARSKKWHADEATFQRTGHHPGTGEVSQQIKDRNAQQATAPLRDEKMTQMGLERGVAEEAENVAAEAAARKQRFEAAEQKLETDVETPAVETPLEDAQQAVDAVQESASKLEPDVKDPTTVQDVGAKPSPEVQRALEAPLEVPEVPKVPEVKTEVEADELAGGGSGGGEAGEPLIPENVARQVGAVEPEVPKVEVKPDKPTPGGNREHNAELDRLTKEYRALEEIRPLDAEGIATRASKMEEIRQQVSELTSPGFAESHLAKVEVKPDELDPLETTVSDTGTLPEVPELTPAAQRAIDDVTGPPQIPDSPEQINAQRTAQQTVQTPKSQEQINEQLSTPEEDALMLDQANQTLALDPDVEAAGAGAARVPQTPAPEVTPPRTALQRFGPGAALTSGGIATGIVADDVLNFFGGEMGVVTPELIKKAFENPKLRAAIIEGISEDNPMLEKFFAMDQDSSEYKYALALIEHGPIAGLKVMMKDPETRAQITAMMKEEMGAGGFALLGEMGGMLNEFTSMIGMDDMLDVFMGEGAAANMNPLLKLLMIAGGILGIGGAIAGNATAGMAGIAMFILPMVFGKLFGGAEAAKENAPGADGSESATASTRPSEQGQAAWEQQFVDAGSLDDIVPDGTDRTWHQWAADQGISPEILLSAWDRTRTPEAEADEEAEVGEEETAPTEPVTGEETPVVPPVVPTEPAAEPTGGPVPLDANDLLAPVMVP